MKKVIVEANNRHVEALEEKLMKEFLWEIRELKNTCVYQGI